MRIKTGFIHTDDQQARACTHIVKPDSNHCLQYPVVQRGLVCLIVVMRTISKLLIGQHPGKLWLEMESCGCENKNLWYSRILLRKYLVSISMFSSCSSWPMLASSAIVVERSDMILESKSVLQTCPRRAWMALHTASTLLVDF